MAKNKIEVLSKKQLIERSKELGFFKKKGIQVIYARSNGNFYYTKPPQFTDGFETFEIKRSDVESKKETKKKVEPKK
ncbi:MAG: hypothetical protein QQN55_04485 [Nitrosopumilus sp.]